MDERNINKQSLESQRLAAERIPDWDASNGESQLALCSAESTLLQPPHNPRCKKRRRALAAWGKLLSHLYFADSSFLVDTKNLSEKLHAKIGKIMIQ